LQRVLLTVYTYILKKLINAPLFILPKLLPKSPQFSVPSLAVWEKGQIYFLSIPPFSAFIYRAIFS
ncbi:MAG: hypothetical protein AAB257_05495, partial [Nitrospinota bacterium]